MIQNVYQNLIKNNKKKNNNNFFFYINFIFIKIDIKKKIFLFLEKNHRIFASLKKYYSDGYILFRLEQKKNNRVKKKKKIEFGFFS